MNRRRSKMLSPLPAFSIVAGLALAYLPILEASHVSAAINQYFSKPVWSAAAGPWLSVETFNLFTVDKSFRIAAGPVAANGFSLVETGTVTADPGTNQVDVPPLGGLHLNGSTFVNASVDFGVRFVRLDFDTPVAAFGADFNGVNGMEQLRVDMFNATNFLLGTIDPTADNTFMGFLATAGERVAWLRFRSSVNSGSAIEAFAFDNAVIAAVPEPSTCTLAVVGGALAGYVRRLRRRTPLASCQ